MSDETLQPEAAEDFVATINNVQDVETTEKVRTKESEIQANIDFWKINGKKYFGIEIDEQEIRNAIESLPEKEGFDWLIAIPKGLKLSDVSMNKWSHDYTIYDPINDANPEKRQAHRDLIDAIQMPRNAQETYAIAARYSAEPDDGSYEHDYMGKNHKSSLEWEQTGKAFMSPMEWIIADMRFNVNTDMRFDLKTDNHLDTAHRLPLVVHNSTLCAGSRTPDGKVPYVSWSQLGAGGLSFNTLKPENKIFSDIGVREVITKDTKTEAEQTE